MKIELKAKHYFLISVALLIIITDIALLFSFTSPLGPKKWYFSPIFVIGAFLGALPFITDILAESKRQKELETKFLEFVRGMVENVRSGVTIPQSILIVKSSGAEFGALTPYIGKLANQIEWGYPLHQAFTVFANDTKNPVIKRSIAIVIQAEKSGGDMASVLQAVSGSVLEIKKLKDEQKSQAYTQTIQGYIIFFVFVAIMIVMQVFLIPKLGEIGGDVAAGFGGAGLGLGGAGGGAGDADLSSVFIGTVVVQGLFAGLMLGKFAEGDFTSGIKHSTIMVIGGYLIITTITGIVGEPEAAAGAATAMLLFIKRKWLER